MSENTVVVENEQNASSVPGNRAAQVKLDQEKPFDAWASTRIGSNLSLLVPILVWSPVLALVFMACAVLQIIDILKKISGSKSPVKPEDQIMPTAKLKDVVKSMKLDDLANRTHAELDALFKMGTTPAIAEFNGMTDGRVLLGTFWPVNRLDYLKLINLPYFPWKGKCFRPINQNEGEGKNRMVIGPLKVLTFPFETKIVPSMFGENDVFTLNYNISGNPWWSRQIRDDMVKLKDGLFLGRANWKWGDGYVFLVYFALRLKDY